MQVVEYTQSDRVKSFTLLPPSGDGLPDCGCGQDNISLLNFLDLFGPVTLLIQDAYVLVKRRTRTESLNPILVGVPA